MLRTERPQLERVIVQLVIGSVVVVIGFRVVVSAILSYWGPRHLGNTSL
jgi:hypothetical protein